MFLRRHTNGPTRSLSYWLLLGVLCLFGSYRGAAQGNLPAASTRPNLPNSAFAIADFDGDLQPDLATVETENGRFPAGAARYSIRFVLASGAAQAFGVIAPAGGLQIVAKDVNGDNALDVLVSTAWQHQQIAVFLNDGHGNFTQVDPSAFAASLWGFDTQCSPKVPACNDLAALLRASGFSGAIESPGQTARLPQQAVGAAASAPAPVAAPELSFRLGRAPPR